MALINCTECKKEMSDKADKCPHCGAPNKLKQEKIRKGCSGCLVVFAGLFFVVMMIALMSPTDPTNKSVNSADHGSENKIENITDYASFEKYIRQVMGKGSYEITIWESDNKLAGNSTQPPFEVIINAYKKADNLVDAKIDLYSVMSTIYIDQELSNNISRVRFNNLPYIRSSLGATDGKQLKWEDFQYSLFYDTLKKYCAYEKEMGPLKTRTWIVTDK